MEFNLRIVTEFSLGDVEISCLFLHFLRAQMNGEQLVECQLYWRAASTTHAAFNEGAPVDAGAALFLFDAHLDTASQTHEDHPGPMGRP